MIFWGWGGQKTSDECLDLALHFSHKGCTCDGLVDRWFSTVKCSAIRSFAMGACISLAGTGTCSLLIPWTRCSVAGNYRLKAAKREASCCPLVSHGTALTPSIHKEWMEETKCLTFTCSWLKVCCPVPFFWAWWVVIPPPVTLHTPLPRLSGPLLVCSTSISLLWCAV